MPYKIPYEALYALSTYLFIYLVYVVAFFVGTDFLLYPAITQILNRSTNEGTLIFDADLSIRVYIFLLNKQIVDTQEI